LSRKKKLFLNALGYQLGWWFCILGVNWKLPYLGPLAMGVFVSLHLLYAADGNGELLFLFSATFLGTLLDSVKASSGFISYGGGYPGIGWLAPMWITAMWAGFASTINHCLKFLINRRITAFAAGAVFGPLAYLTAARFGAITLNLSLSLNIVILSLVWGTVLPLMFVGLKRLVPQRMNS
jgi:Protein of unknown function (DUF2878)